MQVNFKCSAFLHYCLTLKSWFIRLSENLSGIFIQKITEGSAAAQDGRLRENDQIIEVYIIYVNTRLENTTLEFIEKKPFYKLC